MSKVTIAGDANGTGVFTIAAPNGNTNRTLMLPDEAGTIITTTSLPSIPNPLTSGTAVATTSGTAIDFTGIPSWAKRITLLFNAVSTVGGSAYKVQIGSGSFSTSGYAGSTVYAGTSTSGTNNTTGFIMWRGSAGEAQSGSFIIHLIEGTTYIGSGVLGYTSAQNYTSMGGGTSPALSGTLDRIRLTTINGTEAFDAGSINIMYE
jgi:hypothetical protein